MTKLSCTKSGVDLNEVRDRLSGALKFALDKAEVDNSPATGGSRLKRSHSDLHSHPNHGGSSSSAWSSPTKSPMKKRRRRKEPSSKASNLAFHHTFVMKLFDRSLDLAQFPQDMSLYPVCRAWMRNQPQNTDLAPKPRIPTPEPTLSELEGEMEDDLDLIGNEESRLDEDGEEKKPKREKLIRKMPEFDSLPDENNFIRIPKVNKVEFDKDFDINKEQGDEAPSSATLLSNHMTKWWKVRKSWRQAAEENEKRYEKSAKLLKDMFEK